MPASARDHKKYFCLSRADIAACSNALATRKRRLSCARASRYAGILSGLINVFDCDADSGESRISRSNATPEYARLCKYGDFPLCTAGRRVGTHINAGTACHWPSPLTPHRESQRFINLKRIRRTQNALMKPREGC